ncbi:MAG: hypothetical protein V7765_05815 [Oleispira sp.]
MNHVYRFIMMVYLFEVTNTGSMKSFKWLVKSCAMDKLGIRIYALADFFSSQAEYGGRGSVPNGTYTAHISIDGTEKD